MLDADQITNVLFYFFIEEYLYTFLVVFTKISVLFLYIRIFTFPKFRLACYILISVVAAFGISCWVSTGFNCTPITSMWMGWDGQHTGRCIDTAKQVSSGRTICRAAFRRRLLTRDTFHLAGIRTSRR